MMIRLSCAAGKTEAGTVALEVDTEEWVTRVARKTGATSSGGTGIGSAARGAWPSHAGESIRE